MKRNPGGLVPDSVAYAVTNTRGRGWAREFYVATVNKTNKSCRAYVLTA